MSRRKRATYFEKAADTCGCEKIAKKSLICAEEYASLAFDAALTKCKANAAWKTYEMACGHDAMVIEPDSLVEILTELARPLLRPICASHDPLCSYVWPA